MIYLIAVSSFTLGIISVICGIIGTVRRNDSLARTAAILWAVGFVVFVASGLTIRRQEADAAVPANVPTEYQESVPTHEPEPEPEQAPVPEPAPPEATPSAAPSGTMGERNALAKAEQYLSAMAFSYNGLIKQLEYEGFSHDEAVYGADNCRADWNEQAAKKAKNYLDAMPFSRDGLIEQLEYDEFTHEQAVYGVTANGY